MLRHYVLMDGGLVYDLLCASPLFTDPTLPWYEALLPGKNRRIAGPILIDMDLLKATDDTTQSAVEEVLNGFPGRLHVSQLQSEHDLSTLAQHLRRFACFYDEDFLLLGLRFADTRILINLPPVLTPQQWREMTAPVTQWAFLDRRGAEVVLDLPEDRASVIRENKPFMLSIQQLDVLNNAAEPDILLDNLNYTPHMMRNHLYDFWYLAKLCVEIWQQSGSQNREVLWQFASRVFKSNGRALYEHDWVTLLGKAKPQDILTI